VVLRPSFRLVVLTVISHALAIVAVYSTLSGLAMALVLAGAAISAAWCVAKSMLWLTGDVASFEIMPDGSSRWSNCAGESQTARNMRVGWCSELLQVIGFQGADARWHWVLLLPDSAESESLRCLRVWFRWRPG